MKKDFFKKKPLLLPPFSDFMTLVMIGKTKEGKPSRSDQYYEKIYYQFASGKTFSWNWAAAFFGPLWMMYRKMYKEALGFYSFLMGFDLVTTHFMPSSFSGGMAFIVLFGLIGNTTYINYIKRKVDKNCHLALPRANNTDPFAVGLWIIIFLVNIFIAIIFYQYYGENSTEENILILILIGFFITALFLVIKIMMAAKEEEKMLKNLNRAA